MNFLKIILIIVGLIFCCNESEHFVVNLIGVIMMFVALIIDRCWYKKPFNSFR